MLLPAPACLPGQWEDESVGGSSEAVVPSVSDLQKHNPSPLSQINRILGAVIISSTLVRKSLLPYRRSLIFISASIHTADPDG